MDETIENFSHGLAKRIRGTPPDRIVFVGVGNRLRGDDGVGPALIDLLESRMPHALDADGAPENSTGAIKRLKPSAIIFVDALDFGGSPGSVKIIEAEDILKYGTSTHNFSLDVSMDYLKRETGADVFLIGVQPGTIADMEGLSPGLAAAAEGIARAIIAAVKGNDPHDAVKSNDPRFDEKI